MGIQLAPSQVRMPKFRRGDRVKVISGSPYWMGKLGTVTGVDRCGWLRVRFDIQQPYEKGMRWTENGLEAYDGGATQDDQRLYSKKYTQADWLLIQNAVSNCTMMSERDRIRILDNI